MTRRPPPCPEPRDAGMALVEMLVTLSIVALISALMAGYLGQLRVTVRLRAETETATDLAGLADHLGRTLAAARELPLAGGDGRVAFDGTPTAVRFVGVTRRGFRALALRDMRLAAQPDGALVQAMAPRRAMAGADDVQRVVLARGVAVRFEYGAPNGAFTPIWQDVRLPAVIRITLRREVDGRPVTARAVARLR